MSAAAPLRTGTGTAVPPPDTGRPSHVGAGMLEPRQLWRSLPEALRKLNPVTLVRNPVMFVTEIGAALTTGLAVAHPTLFAGLIDGWLWLTVVFANLAEAVAESRGKAQADSLRRTRRQTTARRLTGWPHGRAEETIASSALRRGDHVVVTAGELIPGDGDVVEGVASVDESAITGESAPVIRESGGDRCAVTGGTRVLHNGLMVVAMLLGRYVPIAFVLPLAGRLARQRPGVVTVGTLRASGVNFVTLATGAALILALLNFLPALALGPLVEGLM